MKLKKREWMFIAILLSCIICMILYSTDSDSFRVTFHAGDNLNLSKSEEEYVAEKKNVVLSVSENLEYMEQGFLKEYLDTIVEPSGLKVQLATSGSGKTDGTLTIVTEERRREIDAYQFTAPLFQVRGTLYVSRKFNESQGFLKGVCVKNAILPEEQQTLSYNGKPIRLVEVDTIKEAVQIAKAQGMDCILGDQTAISAYLIEMGIQDMYRDMSARFYENNVCIMISQKEFYLYNILNQCIQSADLHVLAGQAQEHWYGISGALVAENQYRDGAALLIVIFAAVFCTFFFYYQSNKNLYDELTRRMEQVTASKEELQTTFNGVSYYMAELEPDGNILDINTAFLNYAATDCVGRPIGQVLQLPEGPLQQLQEMLRETTETGRGTSQEVSLKRHILKLNIFPIKTVKGDVGKLLFMASDVTEARMAERQMLQDNKMIAVGQLAAGVAHEIRNPLGVIRNYCYVLKNMKNEEIQEQAVERIEKSVDTAGAIIDNLLNFSKVSNRTIEDVMIQEHISSVLMLNKGLMKKKNISIHVECQEDFNVRMAVESFDMIFINLVSNAIDAMDETGVLTIGIKHEDGFFSVEVSDTGTGIEEDILEEIFNPFFTTKSAKEGSGLGLYIVYNEVQKMNGEIKVASKPGEGTLFTVNLPVKGMEGESSE